jgi:hypothetical protein
MKRRLGATVAELAVGTKCEKHNSRRSWLAHGSGLFSCCARPSSCAMNNLNNSYVAGAGAYVKGKFAITPTGVIMKGTGRAFSVVPEELEWGGEVIGRGASGSVMRSRHRPTNTPLALKMINMYDKGKREQIIREINALFDSSVESFRSPISFPSFVVSSHSLDCCCAASARAS